MKLNFLWTNAIRYILQYYTVDAMNTVLKMKLVQQFSRLNKMGSSESSIMIYKSVCWAMEQLETLTFWPVSNFR